MGEWGDLLSNGIGGSICSEKANYLYIEREPLTDDNLNLNLHLHLHARKTRYLREKDCSREEI